MSRRPTASASPGPSSLAFLEQYNQYDLPRPFKRIATFSNSSSGRKRNLKQIIVMEQEAAFDLGGAIGSAARKRKKGPTRTAAGKKEPGVVSADGRILQGAAAKQARRREDRLKKEAERIARLEGGLDAASETASPTAVVATGQDTTDAETSLIEGEVVLPPTEEEMEQQRIEEEERKRKRSLPTYLSVEAPPSLRPAKKYCDVTGLIAPYTDPKTSLRYHSAEIYEIIKTFGPGVDQAYLSLRGRGSTLM